MHWYRETEVTVVISMTGLDGWLVVALQLHLRKFHIIQIGQTGWVTLTKYWDSTTKYGQNRLLPHSIYIIIIIIIILPLDVMYQV